MNFSEILTNYRKYPLKCNNIETIQVNIGYLCNKECTHCHIRAGPNRTEIMNWDTMRAIIRHANQLRPKFIDITGGAPEMNKNLGSFISNLIKNDHPVQVRTNLTNLINNENLIQMYNDNEVKLVASLPCYEAVEVDSVRGKGTFNDSIRILRKLNVIGYGVNEQFHLDLVFNPENAFLPPNQKKLEKVFRFRLKEDFGIVFNNLLTITNMPVGRFKDKLIAEGKLGNYMKLLIENFNPNTLGRLMCTNQISIDYNGTLYDCDFNLANRIPLKNKLNIRDEYIDFNELKNRRIVTGSHCFGCTAGEGSSCSGALVSKEGPE